MNQAIDKRPFECSDCNGMNRWDAQKCVHCGATFDEDDDEEFEKTPRSRRRQRNRANGAGPNPLVILFVALVLSVATYYVSDFVSDRLGPIYSLMLYMLAGLIWAVGLIWSFFLFLRMLWRWFNG